MMIETETEVEVDREDSQEEAIDVISYNVTPV